MRSYNRKIRYRLGENHGNNKHEVAVRRQATLKMKGAVTITVRRLFIIYNSVIVKCADGLHKTGKPSAQCVQAIRT